MVLLSKQAQKDLKRAPIHIVRKLDGSISSVEKDGLFGDIEVNHTPTAMK
jgi:hypothetical protein